jgi:hypothetical protein
MFTFWNWKYLLVVIVENNEKTEFHGFIGTLSSGYGVSNRIFHLYRLEACLKVKFSMMSQINFLTDFYTLSYKITLIFIQNNNIQQFVMKREIVNIIISNQYFTEYLVLLSCLISEISFLTSKLNTFDNLIINTYKCLRKWFYRIESTFGKIFLIKIIGKLCNSSINFYKSRIQCCCCDTHSVIA